MNRKIEKLIEEIRKRHFDTKKKIRIRLDKDENLVYGLCKGEGIDTEGMNPRQAWEALEKKTGKDINEWYKEIQYRKEKYKEKEFQQNDIDRLKNRDYVLCDGEMYEYSKDDGEFKSLFSDKKIKKDEMVGKTASLVCGERGSVEKGQDFTPHKMSKNELDSLGVEDLIIYKGQPYVNCCGQFVNLSDLEETKNPRAFMVNDVVVVKRESSKNEDKTLIFGEDNEGDVSYTDNNGTHSVRFAEDTYSKEKIESARKSYESKTVKDVDDKLREFGGKVWDGLASEQQELVKEYTGEDSDKYNAACRGMMDMGEAKENFDEITGMTNAVRRSKVPEDIMLYRGLDKFGADDMIGEDIFEEGFDLNSLVGRELTDDAFMSTTSLSNENREENQKCSFLDRPLVFEIFTPKGTEAMYVAPVSHYGDNGWDYNSPIRDAKELETIVQRGTTMKILGAERRGKQIIIKTAIIRQKYRDLPTMPE